jgi:hypothetical protein
VQWIPIEKDSIPYTFDIKLNDVTYTFEINYNFTYDFFTVDLYKNDVALIYGEKIILNNYLFGNKILLNNGVYSIIPRTPDFPKVLILPFDASGKATRVTYDNLDDTVLLYLTMEDDLNV